METLDIRERLTQIEAELPEAERRAEAELAMVAATGNAGRWAGKAKLLDELRNEQKDLKLQVKGRELSKALAEFKALEEELERATKARQRAERAVRELAEDEALIRYLKAPSIAREYGYGHSFLLFQQFLESNRARTNGAPECLAFFESASCPEALRFNLEGDRDKIRRYREAVGQADLALMAWGAIADKRQRLLQENPELRDAA
jgi:hypothetical protein